MLRSSPTLKWLVVVIRAFLEVSAQLPCLTCIFWPTMIKHSCSTHLYSLFPPNTRHCETVLPQGWDLGTAKTGGLALYPLVVLLAAFICSQGHQMPDFGGQEEGQQPASTGIEKDVLQLLQQWGIWLCDVDFAIHAIDLNQVCC